MGDIQKDFPAWILGDLENTDKDDYFVTEYESEKRIMLILTIFSTILLMVSSILVVKCFNNSSFPVKMEVIHLSKGKYSLTVESDYSTYFKSISIWQLFNSSETFNFGCAQPHLALVMENGSVWNIKSNDQFKTIEKNLLIQLPKPKDIPHFRTLNYYHLFSTKNGVLNFVKDDISSNIIQYHNSLNNQNHTKVQGSSIKFKEDIGVSFESNNINSHSFAGVKFRYGLQVGSMFWLLFGAYGSDQIVMNDQTIFQSSTMLWFSKKQRWRRGPDLQFNPNSFSSFCSSSLNSTAIFFVFIDITDTRIAKVAIFNFQLLVWTDIPNMKEKLQEVYMTCAMATLYGKQTKPRVMVVFNGIYEYDSILVYISMSNHNFLSNSL